MFWKKEIGFKFRDQKRPPTFPNPNKALCPAAVSKVHKYKPIVFAAPDANRKKPMRVWPPNLTPKTRNELSLLSSQYPALQHQAVYNAFLEEAQRTLAKNVRQVIDALKKDLANHMDNMRTAYGIYCELNVLDSAISDDHKRISDLILNGSHPDSVAAINTRVSELYKEKSIINDRYAAPLRHQHAKGMQIVYHMRVRVYASLDEIEKVKTFYSLVCRALGIPPPPEFMFDRKREEAALLGAVLDKEAIAAMSTFGVVLKDGAFDSAIIDMGVETDG